MEKIKEFCLSLLYEGIVWIAAVATSLVLVITAIFKGYPYLLAMDGIYRHIQGIEDPTEREAGTDIFLKMCKILNVPTNFYS